MPEESTVPATSTVRVTPAGETTYFTGVFKTGVSSLAVDDAVEVGDALERRDRPGVVRRVVGVREVVLAGGEREEHEAREDGVVSWLEPVEEARAYELRGLGREILGRIVETRERDEDGVLQRGAEAGAWSRRSSEGSISRPSGALPPGALEA